MIYRIPAKFQLEELFSFFYEFEFAKGEYSNSNFKILLKT